MLVQPPAPMPLLLPTFIKGSSCAQTRDGEGLEISAEKRTSYFGLNVYKRTQVWLVSLLPFVPLHWLFLHPARWVTENFNCICPNIFPKVDALICPKKSVNTGKPSVA